MNGVKLVVCLVAFIFFRRNFLIITKPCRSFKLTPKPEKVAAGVNFLNLVQGKTCRKPRNDFPDFIAAKLQIKNVRHQGTVVAFEINTGNDGYFNDIGAAITQKSLQNGIYLRPLGNTVYIMPPYCITEEQLNHVYQFLLTLISG